jgi:hypothetical protein
MTTRPVERLYIGNFFVEERNFGGIFDESLRAIITDLGFKEENGNFLFGIKEALKNEEKVSEDIHFYPVGLNDRLWFPEISLINEINNEEFQLSDSQRYGNQLHLLLSTINSFDEIDTTIEKFFSESLIEKEFEIRLREELKLIYKSESYKILLEDSELIVNERKIITSNFESKVPDKVIYKKDEIIVIDFKSGLPHKKHQKQVYEYMNLLLEMESKPVKGFVFYTSNLELVQVSEA